MTHTEVAVPSAQSHAHAAAPEQSALFPPASVHAPTKQAATVQVPVDPKRGARIRAADRSQITWGRIDLDAQLPEEHGARAIWAVIERLDLSALYAQIEARNSGAGAPAIDPKILLALWVYATSEGEGSAREIDRLTTLHAAYRWICGGVDVNYHTLSDFRSQEGKVLNALITQVLALLMKGDLLDLSRTAQDGTRVRASGSGLRPGRTRSPPLAPRAARSACAGAARSGASRRSRP